MLSADELSAEGRIAGQVTALTPNNVSFIINLKSFGLRIQIPTPR